MKNIFITGCAGFIGYHLSNKLINNDFKIIGIDNMSDYYDINLKKSRLNILESNDNFIYYNIDIENKYDVEKVFKEYNPDIVINLAARAGVRYSNDNKENYIKTNIIGFNNIIDLCSNYNVKRLIFASSSSVYGDNNNTPYKESNNTDEPESIYAATKKCDEVLAYAYSSVTGLSITGLRFFTVYGPYGRPDMAYYKFTDKLLNGEKIDIYNHGELKRDFTYIDDIVEGIYRVIINEPKEKYNIYNIGRGEPIALMDFVNTLVNELIVNKLLPNDFNINDRINNIDMQIGDVHETYCDTHKFEKDYDFKPGISLKEGLNRFIKWYKNYYKE